MTINDIPPGVVLLVAAAILPFVSGKARWVVALAAPIIAMADGWVAISDAWAADAAGNARYVSQWQFMGLTLRPVFVHAPTAVFATIFCLMVAGGSLYALNQNRRFELAAAMVYAGGALGCVFSGDLISLFVFWEIMTLGSTTILWCARTEGSYRAGLRYFALHAVGGVLLLAGIALHVGQLVGQGHPDPLAFTHYSQMIEGWTSFGWHNAGLWLMLVGMLVNAGAPPFSAWIGDAYPEATESGTVFLSAFTTKTAVFTLMVAFAGVEVLVYLGLWMAVYGIIYAILENDMRRILAYSIVNQVGFMLVGIGVGTKLSIDGAAAHAFAHIIYKALLMMSAGSVLYATGRRKCTQLGGLYRTMPITMWCGIIGALAISSFPLTSGFTTKSMILTGITEQAGAMAIAGQSHDHLIAAWFILEAASAGVFLHAGIKFPWFVFFNKDSGLRPADPPWNMRAAMILFAGLCLMLGMFPGPLYAILPYAAEAADYANVVYNFEYLLSMLALLLFSGLAFFVLLPLLKRTETLTLDTDWLYRRFFPRLWKDVLMPIVRGLEAAQKVVLENLPGKPLSGEPRSPLARLGTEWAVSVPVFVISAMLLIYLLMYFVILPNG